MTRKHSRVAPRWPRLFMILTAIIIIIMAIVAFSALFQTPANFALAFPLFWGVVILLLFEFLLMYLANRATKP